MKKFFNTRRRIMKKQQLYKLSILVVTATMILGCVKDKPSVQPQNTVVKQSSSSVATSSEATLATLQSSGASTLALKSATKAYKENDPIAFTVNTMGKAGYLYIIYLDNKGDTQLLYPNARSPLTELSGEYIFPRDFGGMSINATKDCNGCSEDKTTIYAILTKEPVSDINSISQGHLLKFLGEKSPSAQGKGIDMSLGGDSSGDDANINIGKIEFIVK
jgi:hypothetical protein